ncbi:MurR/RpiR family transcriptional regulator [Corticibacter populi]|uniref:MurR/RpiR family transcriptional regulator n=1 Tax=Corticibacter populi TaxID=1550736 RepID=A0A3M6R081_9BURK|nr:MurR/RpiR family transcriptional regulator [Corticibacter populi]RMX08667.1 MurR/RpiR family transcriptional regulator [Corticibacter populi]RZS36004.1 RpiR family transcriptional regulator [Corticibacter populi]
MSAKSASAALPQRIQANWAQLSDSERKLAQVLTQPGFSMAGFTARELATLAGISPAGAARFFQKLGYQSFHELRREQRAQPGDSPLERSAPASGKKPARKSGSGGQPDAAWPAHIALQTQQLAALQAALAPTQIDAAVAHVRKAKRIFVLGLRASHVLATYAQALWLQLRNDVYLLGDAAARPSELLGQLRKGDWLVVMDFRRRSSQLLPWMQAARLQGARLLLITDTAASDLVTLADASLCCPNPRHHLFDSHLAAFSLIHYMAVALAQSDPRATRQRLAGIEALHQQLGDLEAAP